MAPRRGSFFLLVPGLGGTKWPEPSSWIGSDSRMLGRGIRTWCTGPASWSGVPASLILWAIQGFNLACESSSHRYCRIGGPTESTFPAFCFLSFFLILESLAWHLFPLILWIVPFSYRCFPWEVHITPTFLDDLPLEASRYRLATHCFLFPVLKPGCGSGKEQEFSTEWSPIISWFRVWILLPTLVDDSSD